LPRRSPFWTDNPSVRPSLGKNRRPGKRLQPSSKELGFAAARGPMRLVPDRTAGHHPPVFFFQLTTTPRARPFISMRITSGDFSAEAPFYLTGLPSAEALGASPLERQPGRLWIAPWPSEPRPPPCSVPPSHEKSRRRYNSLETPPPLHFLPLVWREGPQFTLCVEFCAHSAAANSGCFSPPWRGPSSALS